MKTKFFLISLVLAAVCMTSCEGNDTVSSKLEKGVVKTICQSLDLTPEQFGANMVKQGLHEIPQYDFMADKYKTFANEDQRSNTTISVNINFRNDSILSVEYERSLNIEPNFAVAYRRVSDLLANQGYSDWHGYFDDPDEDHHVSHLIHGGDDYSLSQIANDRESLCNQISNEHLSDLSTEQYFGESFFLYTKNKSRWDGYLLMWSSLYFSGIQEGEGEYHKDIQFDFILKRQ